MSSNYLSRIRGDPMLFPKQVEIIEVSPRDGLQNESVLVPTEEKKNLILHLQKMGVNRIEATSFVNPEIVPQMADAQEIIEFFHEIGMKSIVLTPNLRALNRAIDNKVSQIAVFVGASETFNMRNIKRSIDDSLAECTKIFQKAKDHTIFIRAYVSMSFSCPFEGPVSFEKVCYIVDHFVAHGADEIVIGDTNGQANPRIVYERFQALKERHPDKVFVAHFHDTNGFAYANTIAALQAGIDKFDSSLAGLGGCPFSPGATGNISTEGTVKLLEEMQIKTGINIPAMNEAVIFTKEMIAKLEGR